MLYILNLANSFFLCKENIKFNVYPNKSIMNSTEVKNANTLKSERSEIRHFKIRKISELKRINVFTSFDGLDIELIKVIDIKIPLILESLNDGEMKEDRLEITNKVYPFYLNDEIDDAFYPFSSDQLEEISIVNSLRKLVDFFSLENLFTNLFDRKKFRKSFSSSNKKERDSGFRYNDKYYFGFFYA